MDIFEHYRCRGPPFVGSTPVWEAFLLAKDNTLYAYYSDERDPSHSQKLIHRSTTNGTTWSSIVDDVKLADSSSPRMSTIARMGDGNYILTYEIVGIEGSPVYYKISSDVDDFGDASDMGIAVDYSDVAPGSSGATPYVTWLPTGGPNGTVVLSTMFMDDFLVNYESGAEVSGPALQR